MKWNKIRKKKKREFLGNFPELGFPKIIFSIRPLILRSEVFCETCQKKIKASTKNDISRHVKTEKHKKKSEFAKINAKNMEEIKKFTFENQSKKKECQEFINEILSAIEKSEFLLTEYICSISSDSARYSILKALESIKNMNFTRLLEETQNEETEKTSNLIAGKYNIKRHFPILRKAISKLNIINDQEEKKKISRIIGRFLGYCQRKNMLVNEISLYHFGKWSSINEKTTQRYKSYLKKYVLETNYQRIKLQDLNTHPIKKPLFMMNHIFSEDGFKFSIDKLRFTKNRKAFCINELLYRSGCKLKQLLNLKKSNLEAFENKWFIFIKIKDNYSQRVRIPFLVYKLLISSKTNELFPFKNCKKLKTYLKKCYEKHKICWINPQCWEEFSALRILRCGGFRDPLISLNVENSKNNFKNFVEKLSSERSIEKLLILKRLFQKTKLKLFYKLEYLSLIRNALKFRRSLPLSISLSGINKLKEEFSKKEIKNEKHNNLNCNINYQASNNQRNDMESVTLKNDPDIFHANLKGNTDNDCNEQVKTYHSSLKSYFNKSKEIIFGSLKK